MIARWWEGQILVKNGDTTLQKVVASPVLQKDDTTDLWRLIGRTEALTFVSTLTNAAWAENLGKIFAHRAYRDLQLTKAEFCDRYLPFGIRTAEQLVKDFKEFGSMFFTFQEVASISREAYRQIHSAIDDDGQILIGEEKVQVNKHTIPQIAAHFAHLQSEVDRQKAETATAKADAKKARSERDLASKAAERLQDEAREARAKSERLFPDATKCQNYLLRAQSKIIEACELIRAAVAVDDYQDTDDAWTFGLSDFAIKLIIETTGHDPMAMAVARTIQPESPLDRYQAEHGQADEKTISFDTKKRNK